MRMIWARSEWAVIGVNMVGETAAWPLPNVSPQSPPRVRSPLGLRRPLGLTHIQGMGCLGDEQRGVFPGNGASLLADGYAHMSS